MKALSEDIDYSDITVYNEISSILLIIGDTLETLHVGAKCHVVDNYSGTGYRCEILSINTDENTCEVLELNTVLDPPLPQKINKVTIDDLRLLPEELADPSMLEEKSVELLIEKIMIPTLRDLRNIFNGHSKAAIDTSKLFIGGLILKSIQSFLYNLKIIKIIFNIEKSDKPKYIELISIIFELCKYCTNTNGVTDFNDVRESWLILYQRWLNVSSAEEKVEIKSNER